MKTRTGMKLALWAMVGALAGAMTWGVAPAQADDAVSKSSQPYIAPILPTFEKSQNRGRIGVGEEIRDNGASLRKDLIKKRTIGDILDRSKGGDKGSWIGGGTEENLPPETIATPLETQPISLSYQPAGDPPPVCPEPSGFALAGIGVAGLILYGRRGKR